jgi:ABC-type nitrate/sulfonate/bicarbonate transport system permease component
MVRSLGPLHNIFRVRQEALISAAVFLAIGVVWHLTVTILRIPALLLPGPITVLQAAVANADTLLEATAYTFLEILLAINIAATTGFVTAILIASLPALRRMVFPYIILTQVVPKVALAPILIAWFGIGMQSRLVLAFLIAYFPMVINTLAGIRDPRAFPALHSLTWRIGAAAIVESTASSSASCHHGRCQDHRRSGRYRDYRW